MGRILYLLQSDGGVSGGHKMMVRHVEALAELGFDAAVLAGAPDRVPRWFAHTAPVHISETVAPDDVVVVADDAPGPLDVARQLGVRCVIISQAFSSLRSENLTAIDALMAAQRPPVMVVGPALARIVGRLYPQAEVALVPCFADERVFRPGAERTHAITLVPRKRPVEADVIRSFFRRFDPARADLRWRVIANAHEADVARAFAGATLHLALPRAESVGITTLEAMAAGAVCAGFLGVGGREYADDDNGFWAPEDDCEAAADALARADDLIRTGGPALARVLDAGRETARRWSRAAFLGPLEEFWMRHAPEMRRSAGAAVSRRP